MYYAFIHGIKVEDIKFKLDYDSDKFILDDRFTVSIEQESKIINVDNALQNGDENTLKFCLSLNGTLMFKGSLGSTIIMTQQPCYYLIGQNFYIGFKDRMRGGHRDIICYELRDIIRYGLSDIWSGSSAQPEYINENDFVDYKTLVEAQEEAENSAEG